MEEALNTINENSLKDRPKPKKEGNLEPRLSLLKDQQISELKQRLTERENELRSIKKVHMLAPMNVSDLSLVDSPGINSNGSLQDLMNIYNNLCMKLQENHHKLDIRMKSVLNLGNLMEESQKNGGIHQKDVFRIVETLKELSETLSSVSRNEIELNHLYREIEKKSLEITRLKVSHDKMKARAEVFEARVRELEKKQAMLLEDNNQMMRSVQQETAKQAESGRKVVTLKTRLEAIVQNSHNQYVVNSSIKDLMKENDGLKWTITAKNTEIEKLNEVNQQMKGKIMQLTKKVDNLSQRKKKDSEDFFMGNRDGFPAISGNSIPSSLDFKFFNLKPEFANMLNDLAIYGPSAFATQISSLDNTFQRKAAIDFVTNLYINWRDFAENLNVCLLETLSLLPGATSIEDLKSHVAKGLKAIFKCEESLLWLEDSETGILSTIDYKQTEIRVLKENGVFLEVFLTKNPGKYVKETIIYVNASDGKEKIRERTVVFPVFNFNKDVIGVLELSKFNNFDVNDEYNCLFLLSIIQNIVTKLRADEIIKRQLKFEVLFQEFLLELIQKDSKPAFASCILQWSKRIFSISNTRFLFRDGENFVEYKSPAESRVSSISCGLAGVVLANLRPMIFSECTKNKEFDPNVDISSILPVFFLPIIIKNAEGVRETMGILEVLLKNARTNEIPENLAVMADRFSNIVEEGFKFCKITT